MVYTKEALMPAHLADIRVTIDESDHSLEWFWRAAYGVSQYWNVVQGILAESPRLQAQAQTWVAADVDCAPAAHTHGGTVTIHNIVMVYEDDLVANEEANNDTWCMDRLLAGYRARHRRGSLG